MHLTGLETLEAWNEEQKSQKQIVKSLKMLSDEASDSINQKKILYKVSFFDLSF
ncbi:MULTISPECIES: hypothetical protein [Priestia]|uniref:hypothetical protein n=1 Tax=Priestia TaxID=2800373 RepID=UPI000305BCD1|nr:MULTISPECIES: hypothetical protein [Priestia]MBZ5482689.1 hypothetical protein [Bacillus sp. T_4]MCJ7986678.1 hypothetical protein [Priestia sp. OVL9]MDH6655228.1 hypothetical protein [Bacillus sp. PvP124]MDP9574649.1 hypothetical protein [Bacillus sp. 1751]MEB2277898.1 hypothetical protein [Bacillus sp. ILBB4]